MSNFWIVPDLCSALALGFYDTSKKLAVKENRVLPVLFWATFSGTACFSLLMLALGAFGTAWHCSLLFYSLIWVKSLIVGLSWYFGYAALATLPLSLAAPIRATGPLWTFIGGLLLYHELPGFWKALGMALVFAGYYILSVWGRKEGFTLKGSVGVKYCFLGTLAGAGSALFDKYLLQVQAIPSRTVQLHFSIDLVILFGIALMVTRCWGQSQRCQWRWSIPATGIFLIMADYAFFYAVSLPGVPISQVALIRRTSCLVTFALSALIFKDKNMAGKAGALLLIMLGVMIIAFK